MIGPIAALNRLKAATKLILSSTAGPVRSDKIAWKACDVTRIIWISRVGDKELGLIHDSIGGRGVSADSIIAAAHLHSAGESRRGAEFTAPRLR